MRRPVPRFAYWLDLESRSYPEIRQANRTLNITVLKFESLASTNDEAIEQAKRGADEGLCIVAEGQTAGKGRKGRVWESSENSGLYFSSVLRPNLPKEKLPLLTLMSAVAVFELLKTDYALNPDIKWPNDVLVGEKKICGILAEAVETSKGLAVVVGIGINYTSQNFPDELIDTATSIKDETGKKPDPEKLLQSLTSFLSYFYATLNGGGGSKTILEEWTKRSSYAEGKKVKVSSDTGQFSGITRGVESNGALRVLTDSGSLRIVRAGDVEYLRTS